jgi:DNA repair protein RadC
MKITKFDIRLIKENEVDYQAIDNEKITNPIVAAEFFNKVLEMNFRTQEVLAMTTLDVKNNITGVFEVHKGGLSSSIVEPRTVFQRAIMQNAAGIVLCHNHPSGDPMPSGDDVSITKKLVKGGDILGINIVDHIIIADSQYISFKEKGII